MSSQNLSALGASSVSPASSRQSALELLRSGLETPVTKRLRIITIPAPRATSEQLLALEPQADAMFWAPALDQEWAASGSAAVLTAQGKLRFEEIQRAGQALWSETEWVTANSGVELRPRLFGGFAFQQGRSGGPVWRKFGEARFILPRLLYVRQADLAYFQIAAQSAELSRATERIALLALLDRAWTLLESPSPIRSEKPTFALAAEPRSDAEWSQLVSAIRGGILRGEYRKIVLARRVCLSLGNEVSPLCVLQRLREEAPESTRFALRVQGSTFLGATPEQLIRKQARFIYTAALAGSVDARRSDSLRELLASEKDREEHEIVVRDLMRSLEPLTRELMRAPVPEVQRLRHVLHLRTQIHGTLREPQHVLDLVARLHPTPAVGGLPKARALRWIARHEPDERGWYSGPFGYFDAEGDGEFVVALRSGLLTGRRAELYAGAGIVRESSPATEYQETGWKLRTLLSALGVETWP